MFRRYVWLPFIESLFPAIKLLTGYWIWQRAIHVLVVSTVTYLMIPQNATLRDVSTTLEAAEFLILGLAAVTFLTVLKYLYPITDAANLAAFELEGQESRLISGFIRGSLVALFFAIPFLVSGHYRYLGYFFSLNESALSIVSVVLRAGALVGIVYVEEFLFRRRLIELFQKHFSPLTSILLSGAAYVGIKATQFSLSAMQLGALSVLSIYLGLLRWRQSNEVQGAGFLTGLLVTFHPILSLPILGVPFTGAVLLHFEVNPSAAWEWIQAEPQTLLFLTGGLGGPLSSFALIFVIFVQVVWVTHRQSRFLFTSPPRSIK